MMWQDLESLPIGDEAPSLVHAVVEVPWGSRNKYEPELGLIMRDRVLPGNVRYPTAYGFIPLDVMVAAHDPVFPGCVLRVRPVGTLDVTDQGGRDVTILAVPEVSPDVTEEPKGDPSSRQETSEEPYENEENAG